MSLTNRESGRVLIYSHDTFGLGHLRRCRAIAHSLVETRRDLSILILSGSPLIGSYGFKPRVDFVRIPGVVKLRNGSYSARGLDISIEDAIGMREYLIRASAESFRPHVFLVDKEPLGLQGEVERTLHALKGMGTRLVLGLRDIMDDPGKLDEEWDRKGAMPALENLYDDIWIYGREDVYNPLVGLEVPEAVNAKVTYTGYLRREVDEVGGPAVTLPAELGNDFLLVTAGGGGDGASLIDGVLRAYEQDPRLRQRAFIVTGPFLPSDLLARYQQRAAKLPFVHLTAFVPGLERVMRRASGVIAMGGYNTFCEILTADKPSLILPRTEPRLEQYIRVSQMEQLGLVQMITADMLRDPRQLSRAIQMLTKAPPPSRRQPAGFLDGFHSINAMVAGMLPRATNEAEPAHLEDVRTAGRANRPSMPQRANRAAANRVIAE
ncbi:MAG: glycosyltransferase [Pseudomonadota bacterium]